MWKSGLHNVPQTLTFPPSSVSVTRSCLSIFPIWFTNLYIVIRFPLFHLSFKVGNSISFSLSS
ncbi:hypothetical protein E2C01_056293 [Portunus trituberculatus]|uniref:Uncharacterized protein n=1 Tax=Portunus trituberculatus TaxID=210409 RepID=A0A5B7GQ11_PORTR|nr:hypothetical protein [Portunus trituberculatus]